MRTHAPAFTLSCLLLFCISACRAARTLPSARLQSKKGFAASSFVVRGLYPATSITRTQSSIALPRSVHQDGSCEKNDMECWCMKAVKYTNAVRRDAGVSTMLTVGSKSQLNNANRYAQELARRGELEHQDFDTANDEIRCGRSMGGENIAYNFEGGDIARSCVDQWIGSAGHYENMVRDWFEEAVVGFAYDSRGAVFCVQTFAVENSENGSPSGPSCQAVSSSGSPAPPVTDAPTTTEPMTMTEVTTTTEAPTSTEPSVTTEAPTTTEATVMTEPPMTTEVTTSTEPPTTSETMPNSGMVPDECGKNDMECWCMKAVKYTNEVRRDAGVSTMLTVGSMSQLNNANKYAKELARRGELEHQDFDTANDAIRCGRRLGGENIAYNFEGGDIARSCVDQWIGSTGHYENMVRDWFEEAVVGFAYDSRGAVFCVQTFAVKDDRNGAGGSNRCRSVTSKMGEMPSTSGGDSEPNTSPEPVSVPMETPVSEPVTEPVPVPMETPVSEPLPVPMETPTPEPASPPSGPPSSPGACEKNDTRCWCMKAVKYTNDVRRSNGVSTMLKVGSESMLANADRWAENLARRQGLVHQNFDTANSEVRCGRRISGENIAYNFEDGDYARACVDQWIGSSGHLENMVRDWFEEVVIGFAFDSRGAVYCVQTFAVADEESGSRDGSGCEPVEM